MTATVLHTGTTEATTRRPLLKAGARAGAVAAVATTAVAAVARAIDIPLDIEGEAIPLAGFAQMTLLWTAVGVFIAWACRRRASNARQTFVRITLALTALSFVPDVTAQTGTATKVTLMLTHIVAAAIVIPALSRRLSES